MSRVMLAFPLLLAACAAVKVETADNPQRTFPQNSGFTAHLEISRYPAGANPWKHVWKSEHSQASGFLYKNHVVTAGHIAKEGRTLGSVVAYFLEEPKIGYHLKLIAVNRKYDIALFGFQTLPPTFNGAEFGNYNEVKDGDAVFYVFNVGFREDIPPTLSKGKVVKAHHSPPPDFDDPYVYLLHSCFVAHGSSGSAVLNKNNQVIGMTSARYKPESPVFPGVAKAVRACDIKEWLDEFLK